MDSSNGLFFNFFCKPLNSQKEKKLSKYLAGKCTGTYKCYRLSPCKRLYVIYIHIPINFVINSEHKILWCKLFISTSLLFFYKIMSRIQ